MGHVGRWKLDDDDVDVDLDVDPERWKARPWRTADGRLHIPNEDGTVTSTEPPPSYTTTSTSTRDLVSPAQAEREIGIRAGTVRQWSFRGRLHPAGVRCTRDGGERNLYRVRDILALAAARSAASAEDDEDEVAA